MKWETVVCPLLFEAHMACGTEPPVLPDVTNNPAANDPDFFKTPRKLVRQKWLGGLHSSYRWAA